MFPYHHPLFPHNAAFWQENLIPFLWPQSEILHEWLIESIQNVARQTETCQVHLSDEDETTVHFNTLEEGEIREALRRGYTRVTVGIYNEREFITINFKTSYNNFTFSAALSLADENEPLQWLKKCSVGDAGAQWFKPTFNALGKIIVKGAWTRHYNYSGIEAFSAENRHCGTFKFDPAEHSPRPNWDKDLLKKLNEFASAQPITEVNTHFMHSNSDHTQLHPEGIAFFPYRMILCLTLSVTRAETCLFTFGLGSCGR